MKSAATWMSPLQKGIVLSLIPRSSEGMHTCRPHLSPANLRQCQYISCFQNYALYCFLSLGIVTFALVTTGNRHTA